MTSEETLVAPETAAEEPAAATEHTESIADTVIANDAEDNVDRAADHDGEHTPQNGVEHVDAITEQAEAIASATIPLPEYLPRNHARHDRADRDRSRNAPRPRKRPAVALFDRFVCVMWSGRREPVDDMYWVEATRDGDWIVIGEIEQMRSRKDVLARLEELPSGLVAFNFPFSYPSEFLDSLKDEGVTDWRSLAHKVREDLKKNVDDGARLWIERIGRYRESNLEEGFPERGFPERGRPGDRRFSRGMSDRPLPPYERKSLAERFRRTDHALRKPAGRFLTSPVQIAFNRLTNRYEFSDTQSQGRAALLGMSMLDQLLDARKDASVWPMMKPSALTLVEMLPWTYTSGERVQPEAIRKTVSLLEDRGWEIESSTVDQAARNTDAQTALRCLIGLIKTETREERQRRPIRDYTDAFYDDAQVRREGWFYSVGYRSNAEESSHEKSSHDKSSNREKPMHGERTPRQPVTASAQEKAPVEIAPPPEEQMATEQAS